MEEHLSHPCPPHAAPGENVEISSFLIFYKYSAGVPGADQSYLSSSERGDRGRTENLIFTKLKLDTVHSPGQPNDSNDDNDSNDQSA